MHPETKKLQDIGLKMPENYFDRPEVKAFIKKRDEENAKKGHEMLKRLVVDMPNLEPTIENGKKMWEWFTTFCDEEGYNFCEDCDNRVIN